MKKMHKYKNWKVMKWNLKADCLNFKDKENEDEFAFTL